MRRREFITLFGSAAASSLTAHAQQPERTRRIGVLMFLAEDDAESRPRIAAFIEGLQQLGWIVGRNTQLEIGARPMRCALVDTPPNWRHLRPTSFWPQPAKARQHC